jgi:putative PIN family toxin of toxin-antitoxin system
MVDANIIISAALFPDSVVGKALTHIVKTYELVLCQYTLDEVKRVFQKKFPERGEYLKIFLKKLKYEIIKIEIKEYKNYPQVRDIKDIPILAYAIESKVNVFLTGDKDFDEIFIYNPKILNPRKYIEEYIK